MYANFNKSDFIRFTRSARITKFICKVIFFFLRIHKTHRLEICRFTLALGAIIRKLEYLTQRWSNLFPLPGTPFASERLLQKGTLKWEGRPGVVSPLLSFTSQPLSHLLRTLTEPQQPATLIRPLLRLVEYLSQKPK